MESPDNIKPGELENLPFEVAMEQLEEVVDQLENGEVPLEEAIRLFERGMRLARLCGTKLEHLESQVEMLVQENGDWVKKPFSPEGDGE
ncbi:exodeoxyribonuclease VII small subunit [Marininema halotolerans]|uniref:Exodeoxyribonuclease 7 small subunit n=1 Tax=Marininema halotolerans TaxID=1155944 RepID=A0A1I6TV35_9BACL|nr:exodeoxyribonuclease VII small subunit [Marininema halotolerans]SFS93093.1 exodeoxyribonuclease VII small subunit [Marininema halotolerans]